MNETDQKILERPELDPRDSFSRNHASDLEDDLDALGESIDRYDGAKG